MLKSCVVVVAAIVMLVTASTAAADPPRPVGGLVDLEGYCQTQGYDWVDFPRGQLGDHAAIDNWRCANSDGRSEGLNMTQACKWQYALRDVHARFKDINDAFSWVCYSSGDK